MYVQCNNNKAVISKTGPLEVSLRIVETFVTPNHRRLLLHNSITLLLIQDRVQVMNIQVRVIEILMFIIRIRLLNDLFPILKDMLLPELIRHLLTALAG